MVPSRAPDIQRRSLAAKPLVAVILSGGTGARLWPVSREALPKPFIKLHDGKSLLQRTIDRVIDLPDLSCVLTVTNRNYYFLTRDEYAESQGSHVQFEYLLEPFGRNTAPAIAAAARIVAERFGDDAIMLVLPADHVVADQSAFNVAVETARKLAANGWLVAFGMSPRRPETGYGYIKCGKRREDGLGHTVAEFVEKPDADRAEEFVRSGQYLWNSGMFCFSAGAISDAMQEYCPDVWNSLSLAIKATDRGASPILIDSASFEVVPDISIDYAVMERSSRVAVVTGNFGWEDVGSWRALSEMMPADANGNRLNGEALMLDATNCFIQSESKTIAVIGVNNLIVVDTPDALLITERERSQEVKTIVDRLKLLSHATVRHHRTVHRPWGSYTVLEEGDGFKIKRIVVRPGASLSLQRHRFRSEHWVVVSGEAMVTNEGEKILISKNESAYISAGASHRLSNPGGSDCVMIEVQVGSYVGEDDIERLDDVYGRTSSAE